MTEYVCAFVRCGDEVLLTLKNQPAWQRGRLNGVGGKMEPDESPDEAMSREWDEETHGVPAPEFRLFHTIDGPDWRVHFFAGDLAGTGRDEVPTENDVGELLQWHSLNASLDSPDWLEPKRAIANLSWLIPMAHVDTAHIYGESGAENES